MVAGTVQAATDSSIRSIDIVQNSDGYVANVIIVAPVSATVAWEVLTDFDHMAKWIPNLRESTVTAREANALTIAQHGVAKYGLVSFPYVSDRELMLDPPKAIRSRQTKGSMRKLESLMTLAPDPAGTRMTYRLEMVPSVFAAAVLSKEFLDHEIREQFEAIIEEMVRRDH